MDAVAGTELGQQPGHVCLGGGGADDQAIGDLAVGPLNRDEIRHQAQHDAYEAHDSSARTMSLHRSICTRHLPADLHRGGR
jgi:hypothetical protein